MDSILLPGTEFTFEHCVGERETAIAVGSGGMPVLSTPSVVALLEKAAFTLVETAVGVENTTVGIAVRVKHLRATAVGVKVKVSATLLEVDKRHLLFRIEAYMGEDLIAEGEHERVIVDRKRFLSQVSQTKTEG